MSPTKPRKVSLKALSVLAISIPLFVFPSSFAQATQDNDKHKVIVYDEFEHDLAKIISRDDNVIRYVNQRKRERILRNLKSFAKSMKIPTDNFGQNKDGTFWQKVFNNENELASYIFYTANQNKESLEDEISTVRQTWSHFIGSTQPLSDETVIWIAKGVINRFQIPLRDREDQYHFASTLQTRDVKGENDETTVVLRQVAGFYRRVGDRQVVNSTLKIDINPLSKQATGLSIRNWWGLSQAKVVVLKDLEEIKNDIKNTMLDFSDGDHQIKIHSCEATYYQTSTALVPGVTCYAGLVKDGELQTYSPIGITVSVTPGNVLDEGKYPRIEFDRMVDKVTSLEEKEDDDNTFSVYYTTDETRFNYGAAGFRDYFENEWTLDGYLWAYSNYWVANDATYADDVDLIYIVSHGGVRGFPGEDAKVWVNNASTTTAELGDLDLEYVTHAGCHLGGAIYCDAMKATKRYRASSSRNSAFNGLHNFSGNHGVGISNNNLHYNKAKTYAQYLRAGMDFREAWQDASLDTANWTNNYEKGCYIIPNPSTGCGMSGTAFDCSRWWAYPSTFYIKEQRNETIYNRDSYADDYQYGDAEYDVDLTYTYQSESVPISATGYSLP